MDATWHLQLTNPLCNRQQYDLQNRTEYRSRRRWHSSTLYTPNFCDLENHSYCIYQREREREYDDYDRPYTYVWNIHITLPQDVYWFECTIQLRQLLQLQFLKIIIIPRNINTTLDYSLDLKKKEEHNALLSDYYKCHSKKTELVSLRTLSLNWPCPQQSWQPLAWSRWWGHGEARLLQVEANQLVPVYPPLWLPFHESLS